MQILCGKAGTGICPTQVRALFAYVSLGLQALMILLIA